VTNFCGFLLGILLDPEDVGDMFPQNVKSSPTYTVLQLRRPHISFLAVFTMISLLNPVLYNASKPEDLYNVS
jgi:hypothetical protein